MQVIKKKPIYTKPGATVPLDPLASKPLNFGAGKSQPTSNGGGMEPAKSHSKKSKTQRVPI